MTSVSEKTSMWKVAKSGSFWVAADWTNGVPNASTDVLITTPGTYTVSSAETGVIDALSLAAGATLAITDSSTLTVTDGTDGLTSYTNYGWIKVGLGSALNIGKAFTDSAGRIYSVGDTTISDATLKLSNSAVITSDGGVVTLSHDNIIMDSNSQLRGGVPGVATPANEVLNIIDSAIRGGQVLDREGSVYLTDDRLYGVLIDGYSGIYVDGSSNLFDGVTAPMIIYSNVQVEDGAALTLSGQIETISIAPLDEFDPFGGFTPQISLNSSGDGAANTELLISGTVLLYGSPSFSVAPYPTDSPAVHLSDSLNNVIDGTKPGSKLWNGDVIEGSGHIGVGDGSLSVINYGRIVADYYTAFGINTGLYIDTGSSEAVGVLINGGDLEAKDDSLLCLTNTDVKGGTAFIFDESTLELQGSSGLFVDFAGDYLNGGPDTEYLTLDTPFDNSFTTGGSTIGLLNDDYINLVGLNYLSSSTQATYSWSGGSTGLLKITNGHQTVDLNIVDGNGVYKSNEFYVSNYTLGGKIGTTVMFAA